MTNMLQERHDEHHPGTWVWPHLNTTVQWTDWADGQPNNYQVLHNNNLIYSTLSLQGQNCVTMLEFHNPLFPWARDFFWNDVDCTHVSHYICQNVCNVAEGTT